MSYKKLVNDLLSEYPKYCAACKYSKGVEFNCTIDKMAVNAIIELFGRVEQLEKENYELLKRSEQAERERDAAIFDLIRAEYAAKETCRLLDNEIYPVCGYYVYSAVHDSVSDIVNWEQDNVWRGKKEE